MYKSSIHARKVGPARHGSEHHGSRKLNGKKNKGRAMTYGESVILITTLCAIATNTAKVDQLLFVP